MSHLYEDIFDIGPNLKSATEEINLQTYIRAKQYAGITDVNSEIDRANQDGVAMYLSNYNEHLEARECESCEMFMQCISAGSGEPVEFDSLRSVPCVKCSICQAVPKTSADSRALILVVDTSGRYEYAEYYLCPKHYEEAKEIIGIKTDKVSAVVSASAASLAQIVMESRHDRK